METVKLLAKRRQEIGKRASRNLRRNGKLPAVVYGHGIDSMPLTIDEKEFVLVLHTKAGENVVIDLEVEGVKLKESTCLIRSMAHNPVTDEIAHVDLTVISMTEKITVNIPIIVQNAEEAVGVKEGGVLDVIHHEIEIECLPTQIPEGIRVDVKEMKIGDVIYMKDLPIQEGVSVVLPKDESIISLHPPKKVEEEVPVEGEEITEPEVIEKGLKAEGKEAEEKPESTKPAKED